MTPGQTTKMEKFVKKLITAETLRKWGACAEGFKRFCKLFTDGADLQTASKALIDDGHADWSNWLWIKCKNDDDYVEQTVIIVANRGTATAGDYGTATAGYRGTATAGDFGTATAGDRGTATAGYFGTATAGDFGSATAGYSGSATAGNYGVIVIRNHNAPYQLICAQVDGVTIKPDVFYKLNDNAQFVEVQK